MASHKAVSLPPRKRDRKELILTCPSIIPPFREDHLTDTILSLAYKAFFLFVQLTSPLGVWSQDHASAGNIWLAVLFFHYFTRTIFLFYFKAQFLPRCLWPLPAEMLKWDLAQPVISFYLPAVIKAEMLLLCNFWPFVSSVSAPCSVPSPRTKWPNSSSTYHKNHLTDYLLISNIQSHNTQL